MSLALRLLLNLGGYQDEAGKEEQGPSGGSVITDDERTQFDAWLAQQEADKDKPPASSDKDKQQEKTDYQIAIDAQAAEDAEKKKKETFTDVIRGEIEFDSNFDKLITDNSKLFKNDAAFFRKNAKGLSAKDSVHYLKCMAAQDFFATESNLELLTAKDKAYIQSSVAESHERNINSTRAWEIFESAMNVASRLKIQNEYRQNGGGGGGDSATPMLDAFIAKSKHRIRGTKPE